MNQLVEYISSISNIKKVQIITGSDAICNIVNDFSNYTQVSDITIHFLDKIVEKNFKKFSLNCNSNNKIHKINIKSFGTDNNSEWDDFDENTVLLFDGIEDIRIIYKLKKLKAKYVIGSMEFSSITSFEVWEQLKNTSEQIYIISYSSNGTKRSEVLNWQKNMVSNIELSIIFPMYNISKYLPECIASVTEWKADYIEFLFVDDGSPDNCSDIVLEAAKSDSRIKLLKKENGGCASARQYGLENAKGRYVGFIDPDDFIDPSMYRKLLRKAFIGNYDISYCGYKEFYEELNETKDIPDLLGWPYFEGTTDKYSIMQLVAFLRVAIWRGIYRKEMLINNNIHFYTEIRRFDDLPFKVEVYSVAKSVISVPEYLYFYRMGRPGQDVSANDERLYIHFPIFKHLDEFADKNGTKEFTELLQIVKLSTHIFALNKLLPKYRRKYLKLAKKDLLNNVSYKNTKFIFKNNVSRMQLAYFYGIMLRSKAIINYIQKRQLKKMEKIEKSKNYLLKKSQKLVK